jgi:nucleoside-diphosphate-sugar epimerase
MLKRVIVFGVHSYIGFGLCERLLNEGVEIKGILSKPNNPIQKKLLEERLMMVARNAMFQTNEVYENTDEDKEVDMILHCCDDSNEHSLMKEDRINVMKSVELAHKLNVPYLFISSSINKEASKKDHIKFCEDYLNENMETRTHIKLPILYGPFQPSTERIHQFLVNREKDKENVLIIKEPLLFIQDAVDSLWDLIRNVEKGKTYSLLGEVKQEGESSFLLEFQLNGDIFQEDEEEKYFIKEPTSIEKGLKAQAACIKKYREILNM